MKIADGWHWRASSRRPVGLLGFASSGRRLPAYVRTSTLHGKRRGPVGLPGMSRGRGNYVGPSPLPVLAYTSDEGPSFRDVQADPLARRRRECIARMTAACSAFREHRRAPRYVQSLHPAHSTTCGGRFGLGRFADARPLNLCVCSRRAGWRHACGLQVVSSLHVGGHFYLLLQGKTTKDV